MVHFYQEVVTECGSSYRGVERERERRRGGEREGGEGEGGA